MAHFESVKRAASAVGNQVKLARAIGVKPPTVNQWIKGRRPVPIPKCIAIEQLTQGVVRCEELRPDIAWDVLRMQAGEGATPEQEASHG